MKVRVVYALWHGPGFDEPLAGGVHDLDDVTEEQARSIAGAESAGALEVVEETAAERKLLDPHVQSQEDGEAEYAAAQEGDRWQHGNLLDFVAVKKDRLLHDDKVAAGQAEGEPLPADARAEAERQVAEAEATLRTIEEPT